MINFLKVLLLINYVIGDDIFNNHCNMEYGFSWCDTSNKCLRDEEEPCLPITKECALCLVEHYGHDDQCGEGCSMQTLQNMENAGFLGTDENGCSIDRETIWCPSLDRCIEPTRESCRKYGEYSDNCNNTICPMVCEYGYEKDTNNCRVCRCSTEPPTYDNCHIKRQKCNDNYLCPLVEEVTHCSYGGVDGYTTYRLSVVFNDKINIKNVYALFGDSQDNPNGTPITIPPAYQGDSIFNSNLGGISPDLIRINYLSQYDSWLTIGLTDGDPHNKLSSIGVDFSSWSETNGLIVENGAVFLLDPNEENVHGNKYVVGQITIPTGTIETVNMNIQGQTQEFTDNQGHNTWKEYNIEFDLSLSNINSDGH